ncbi:hypothetical protein OKW42_006503 [Paraburkholderia sp. WC7.3d]
MGRARPKKQRYAGRHTAKTLHIIFWLLKYDWLVDAHDAPVITRDQLRVHPFSVQTWDAQSSGTIIKPIAEGALEKRWAELTGKRKAPTITVPGS